MDTTITQVEWMDVEATTNDNDAIDADMHARAGDAELIAALEQRQPLVPLAPLIPRHRWARPRRRCCGHLTVAPTRAPLARCFLGCASWKQFSRLQKAFCFCEKLTLLNLVPIDEAPASSSMLRAVCVLCCCVRVTAATGGAPMCWSPD